MLKSSKNNILIVLFLVMLTIYVGYIIKSTSKNTFGIKEFTSKMESKNYKFEIQDVEKDFLPTTRKRMIIDKEVLDIYIYSSNEKMENDARKIDSGGGGYRDGNKGIEFSWSTPPHFFKKGKLIVQYNGGSEKILSDLKEILGVQFAGQK